jgi:nitrogen regulatory protein P-II 1
MKRIEAIIRPERMEQAKVALTEAGFAGLHVENVVGRGAQRGVIHSGRGGETYVIDMLPKVKMVVVINDSDVERVIELISGAARTGNIGDGKIFVSPVEEVVRVRTGERGPGAL